MLSRRIEKIKYLLWEYGLYIFIYVLLSTISIYYYNETLILEEELARVYNVLHVKQVNYERRQEEHYKIVEQQQAQLKQMIKEIKSCK